MLGSQTTKRVTSIYQLLEWGRNRKIILSNGFPLPASADVMPPTLMSTQIPVAHHAFFSSHCSYKHRPNTKLLTSHSQRPISGCILSLKATTAHQPVSPENYRSPPVDSWFSPRHQIFVSQTTKRPNYMKCRTAAFYSYTDESQSEKYSTLLISTHLQSGKMAHMAGLVISLNPDVVPMPKASMAKAPETYHPPQQKEKSLR